MDHYLRASLSLSSYIYILSASLEPRSPNPQETHPKNHPRSTPHHQTHTPTHQPHFKMPVVALVSVIAGSSSRRSKGNRAPLWVLFAILFGILLGIPLLIGLCRGVVRCVSKCRERRRVKKKDIEAHEESAQTPGGEAGAKKSSFESIELREVGVEGPP